MMELILCIDDTDNLESIGTGKLASRLAGLLETECGAACSRVTRHQLFVHQDIPYTSHNSAMCFRVDLKGGSEADRLLDCAASFLEEACAPGSDPGLCIAPLRAGLDEQGIVRFGRRAKQTILSKEEAYAAAKSFGLHLSEHGGDGQGVVGALAGIGLRLSGNDGRFRGWFSFEDGSRHMEAAHLAAHPFVDEIRSLCGDAVGNKDLVGLVDRIKTVLLDGRSVLLVEPCGNGSKGDPAWQILPKERLKAY
jgi:hypothetical protein